MHEPEGVGATGLSRPASGSARRRRRRPRP
jgi:hypothetical protein